MPNRYYIDNHPTWSPDARQVAFARTIPIAWQNGVPTATETEIFSVTVNGEHLRRLTHDHAEDGDPAWSPNGRAIAFVRAGNIIRLDLRTHLESRLISNGEQPAWSPDGRRLAFVRTAPDTGERAIFTASASGHQVRRLTPVGTDARQPAWSPDGRRIVFTRYHGRPRPADALHDRYRRQRTTQSPGNAGEQRARVAALDPDKALTRRSRTLPRQPGGAPRSRPSGTSRWPVAARRVMVDNVAQRERCR